MDVGALTWRNCWACGSHTHERKDCWYTNVTCKKCGKRGRMTSVCWVKAGKAQKGKGKSESEGENGDIQAVLLKWTRIEKTYPERADESTFEIDKIGPERADETKFRVDHARVDET